MRISRTARPHLLHANAYGTYPAGAPFGPSRRTRTALKCRTATAYSIVPSRSPFVSEQVLELLKSVARRIVDRHVLRLLKLWLKAPIEERDDGHGTRPIARGKSNPRGRPQRRVGRPLL